MGLSYPLSKIETTVFPQEQFGVIKFNETNKVLSGWTFVPIECFSDYLGTIAIEMIDAKINVINLSSIQGNED